ncbi:MAG TPA: O-antigen ligase family protein [Acidobacteriota bacterium]|nr:O-antigen ligase family protein [Acidobacteriota bacterium]
MITWLKAFLYSLFSPIAVPLVYLSAFLTILSSIFKKAEWGLFVLVALIPLPNLWYLLHPYPFGKDLIDLLVFAVFVGIFVNKDGLVKSNNSAFLLLFILVNYASLWNTSLNFSLPPPTTTENELLRDWKNYAEMIFLYVLVVNTIRDDKQLKTLLLIATTVILLIAVREYRNFSEGAAFSYDKRSEGPFWVVGLGANHLGAFIAEYGAFLLGLFLCDDDKKRRLLYLAAVLFSIHPLFFSYSRGAYAAAFVALVFLGLVKKRSLLILATVIIVSWQTLLPVTVTERISMTESSSGNLEASAAHRIELWEEAKAIFENNPIFGIGFGGFGLTVPPDETLTDTHSFYMRTLSEQGIIGIGLFLILLARAFGSGWRLYRTGQTPFYKGMGLGFVACIVAASVSNLFGDRWSYFVLGGYLFVFWGLVDRAILNLNAAPEAKD